jgi:hypothetical protein
VFRTVLPSNGKDSAPGWLARLGNLRHCSAFLSINSHSFLVSLPSSTAAILLLLPYRTVPYRRLSSSTTALSSLFPEFKLWWNLSSIETMKSTEATVVASAAVGTLAAVQLLTDWNPVGRCMTFVKQLRGHVSAGAV